MWKLNEEKAYLASAEGIEEPKKLIRESSENIINVKESLSENILSYRKRKPG